MNRQTPTNGLELAWPKPATATTTMSRRRWLGAGGVAIGAMAASGWPAVARPASPVATTAPEREQTGERWVAAWAAAPRTTRPGPEDAEGTLPPLTNRTFRQVVPLHIGGDRLRVRLGNAHGAEPVVVEAASIALAGAEAGIVRETARPLTFGGLPTITLPRDAVVASDPVELPVAAHDLLAVSLYLPGTTLSSSSGVQAVYVSPEGDFTTGESFSEEATARSLRHLTGIDVVATPPARAIVAIGASVTEGFASTPGANRRWTDVLAARLLADPDQPSTAVLNLGIDGNRLLHEGYGEFPFAAGANTLARFDRDVLAQPGASHVVFMQGLGDIGGPVAAENFGVDASAEVVSVEEVIAAHRILIERARGHGLIAIGGTLTPWAGTVFHSPETEAMRQEVNNWIRTGGAYDAVIDFEAVLRDPEEPARLLPAFDSGDHGHPNDAGYQAMGEAVDLALFQGIAESR